MYIYLILYIHIHIKVNYAIYETEFMKKLSDKTCLHKKTLSFDELHTTILPVTFCCSLFVLGNFVRFFYDYRFFYWAFLLIT